VTYSFEVLRDAEGCVEGKVVAVLVDDSGKPRPWPEHMRRLLEPGG
jgi:acyl-CoA thioesterase FadM